MELLCSKRDVKSLSCAEKNEVLVKVALSGPYGSTFFRSAQLEAVLALLNLWKHRGCQQPYLGCKTQVFVRVAL